VDLTQLLTFLHIAAAIIWLGAGFLLMILVLGAVLEGDRQREAGYHRDVGWLAPRLFIPASLSTFVLGVLLVIDGSWTFDQLWITIGMAGWLISFCLGFFYFKPEGQKIAALVAERGPADPEADRRLHRLNIVDRVQLVVLFIVVADMVVQPTGDDVGFLVVCGLVLAAAAAAAYAYVRRGPAKPGDAPA
jgi:uncharacterized membrane protein